MRFSSLRIFQWLGVAAGLFVLVGLNYDFKSEAGMRMNAPVEDPLSQGMLGYWKMDEGTGISTTADASGNATTLTMTNIDSGDWQTGQIGPYMLDLDGAANPNSEYLTVADPSSGILDFVEGKDFTLTGWFNRDTSDTDDTLIAKRTGLTSSNAGYSLQIPASGDLLTFVVSDGDGANEYSRASSTAFTTTGWHQFAAVWENDLGIRLYVDGAENQGSASGTLANIGDIANGEAFRIGVLSDASTTSPFDGKLDDIRVYGYPLSAGDVLKLYQTTAPAQPVDTGLVGHWTFDGPDIQNVTAIDKSGKGNHGTMTGTTKTIGKLGQGLSFNGTSDYVDAGSASSLDNIDLQGGGGMSISVWIKPRSAGFGNTGMIAAKDFGSDGEWHFYTGVSGRVGFAKTYSGVDLDVSSGDDTYSLNQWTHIALTWDGSATATHVHIYANGAEASYVIQTNGTNTKQSDIAMSLFIGGAYGYDFDGIMDDLRIYNRVITTAEITNLYNVGK